MLTTFNTRYTFNKLRISLMVDCENEEASATVTYDRRIMRMGDIPFWEVSTPDKADAYFRRFVGERGSLIETLEWQCRSGILEPA